MSRVAKKTERTYAMRKSSMKKITFTSSKRRQVEAAFDGGAVSSHAGLLMVREVDRELGLIRSITRRIADERQKGKVRHRAETMLRQRGLALRAGWEDLNHADQLRYDPVHQIAADGVGNPRGAARAVYRLAPEAARLPDPGLRRDRHPGAWPAGRTLLSRLL